MDMQTLYALVYIEINIVSLVLVGIIRFKTSGIARMMEQRNFAMSIDTELISFVADTLFVMMKYGFLPFNEHAVLILKSIYFLAITVMCYFWFVYFELMQGSEFIQKPENALYSSGLVWLMSLLLVVNAFTGILFYVDDSGTYRRGAAFAVVYVVAYTYVFVTCFRAFLGLFNREKFMQRRNFIWMAVFPIIPAGAGIIQFIVPELPSACAALSLAALIMYLNWTERMISVDPLTKLSNRQFLQHSYEQWATESDSDEPLYLLMIDANSFKKINDTYGHIQGDAALIRIATALEMACSDFHGRKNIARYGGDEFVILLYTDDIRQVNNISGSISVILKRLNKQANAPYDLTVSIGTAMADREQTIKELIEMADEDMYLEKERMHNKMMQSQ
ncbi:MAG: GGDEF domain-containing protein [Oscillospiraceae bacterium]|nr:GGDEF domain-containing protein [Oscillospiraceae bacterium]